MKQPEILKPVLRIIFNLGIPVILIITGLFFSCKRQSTNEILSESKDSLPSFTLFDSYITYSDSGLSRVKIFSDKMDRYGEKFSLYKMEDGIKVVFYNEQMQVISELTADYGEVREEDKIMEVKRNVVFINEKGEKLNTEHLIWQQDSAKIFTEGKVKITQEGSIIHGNGLIANETFSKYKILDVTGTTYIEGK